VSRCLLGRLLQAEPSGTSAPRSIALACEGTDRPGTLHAITTVILAHRGNITGVEIPERGERARVHVEIDLPSGANVDRLVADLRALDVLAQVEIVLTMAEVYGKRIIVVGGGAQVGQVALGAISEADRHNIRGEKISIDTIPIVGEQTLAAAVRAVARLPRAVALVLAGALMGGEITAAVEEVRRHGILVVSLNMAGSAPKAADLIVSDPVQAGVMAVMAVARTASFDIARQRGRTY
jgi:energy-converting hydrogenase B subunit Q